MNEVNTKEFTIHSVCPLEVRLGTYNTKVKYYHPTTNTSNPLIKRKHTHTHTHTHTLVKNNIHTHTHTHRSKV